MLPRFTTSSKNILAIALFSSSPMLFSSWKSLTSALRTRLLYNRNRPPLVPVYEIWPLRLIAVSHPKVFPGPDDASDDGGTPRVLRGPLPGARPCDSSGGARPRPHGATAGFVSAFPRRFAGTGSRRGERVRCAHDAAGARLADDGWGPRPGVAVVPRLRSISADRPSLLGARSRLGLLPLPPLGQRAGFRARGDPSSDSNGSDPRRHAPQFCPGSAVPFGRRPRELLGLPHCAE